MLPIVINMILGLLGAWVVNYLSDVLPRHRKFVSPICLDCQAGLDWRFYITFTPCPDCGARPSRRHWAVVFMLPILAVLLHYFPPAVFGPVGGIVWLVYFAVIVVIDMEHRLILHPVSLVGAILGILFGIRAHGLVNTLIGGAAGFGIMLGFYYLGELFIRWISRRRGEEFQEVALGFGDVNLSGIMGLILGWPGVVGGLIFAILAGGVISGLYLLIQLVQKKYQAFQALPYGPFIILGTLALLYMAKIT